MNNVRITIHAMTSLVRDGRNGNFRCLEYIEAEGDNEGYHEPGADFSAGIPLAYLQGEGITPTIHISGDVDIDAGNTDKITIGLKVSYQGVGGNVKVPLFDLQAEEAAQVKYTCEIVKGDTDYTVTTTAQFTTSGTAATKVYSEQILDQSADINGLKLYHDKVDSEARMYNVRVELS